MAHLEGFKLRKKPLVVLKCNSPPPSLEKFIPDNIKIPQSPEPYVGISSSSDESDNESSRSPSPRRERVCLNQFLPENMSDNEERMSKRLELPEIMTAGDQQLSLKMPFCTWRISNFNTSKLNENGYINSPIFTAGLTDELKWFSRIERYKQGKNVFYGIYICKLTMGEQDAVMDFKGYIKELRGHYYKFSTSKTFPQKEGYEFLGYLSKNLIRDDEYWYFRMLPNDCLTLVFRITVQYLKFKNQLHDDLKEIWRSKAGADFIIDVRGVEIPVHKSILASRSPYFMKMFTSTGVGDSIRVNDFEPEMMSLLVQYMYTGKLEKLIKYLKMYCIAADRYDLKELKTICEKVAPAYS